MKLMATTAAFVASSAMAIAFGAANPAQAANFSFRGNFTKDNDVQLFNFTVGSPSNVTLKTLSYAGGTQADGTIVSRGGFDPILSLFDGSGNFITNNDDGKFPDVGTDSVTDETFDTFLQSALNPGSYTVTVAQFNNFFNGTTGQNISLGFVRDGQPNFANGFIQDGNQRTNAWAFDVLNVDQSNAVTAVPTPALLPGLIGLGVAALRKRKAEAAEQANEA